MRSIKDAKSVLMLDQNKTKLAGQCKKKGLYEKEMGKMWITKSLSQKAVQARDQISELLTGLLIGLFLVTLTAALKVKDHEKANKR